MGTSSAASFSSEVDTLAILSRIFAREEPGNMDSNIRRCLPAWDSIASSHYFAIAMMQHIRDELLRADQSGCMKLLMHYPCQQNVAPLIARAHFADSDVALSREFNGY